MKLSPSRIVGLFFVIAIITGLIIAYQANQTIRNAYAVWWVADMVIEHLKANEDRWPADWDDLRDDYETCIRRSGKPWTFEELRSRVVIDFEADVSELKEKSKNSEQPEFRVIWLSDGSATHWSHQEPNTKLLQYFNNTTPPAPIRTGFGGSHTE
ncbi:hypothetical protein [uncultured Rubinisphaera sp.]|uniref:hypothetical protein n=1 Tax=uncultured Rubinisphaera sp. TaxID=1678686 RepID=UPI0030D7766F|tara:strand:- start:369 stop:833 length:465 start_codon:yes stop_codon:yes gene_type:complete